VKGGEYLARNNGGGKDALRAFIALGLIILGIIAFFAILKLWGLI
jgi:hypothetical protein